MPRGALQAEILGLGLLATVLVLVPVGAPGNERHDLPKEFLVHLLALAAAGAALARTRRLRLAGEDVALAAFLLLGLTSAAGAVNPWLAARASALACSAVAAFWAVRAADRRSRRRLAALAAGAVVAAAAAALLEAYGVVEGLSSSNRAPGGTIGHRNRLAHLLVLGLPLLAIQVLRARERAQLLAWCAGVAAVGAALTLSRSRAAWLAAAVVVTAAVLAALLARRAPHRTPMARQLALAGIALLLGATVAVTVPNQLGWHSDAPYRDSLATLVDHREGSGRGRLIQYANTLRMAVDHPVLGVGPGNWAIHYPSYASQRDPSYFPTDPLPTSRVPQGDWVALLAERGLSAAAAVMVAALVLLARCMRTLRRGGPSALHAGAAVCVGAAILAMGLLDAVLMTPTAALLSALALAALVPDERGAWMLALPLGPRRAVATGALAVLAGGVLLGAVQVRGATMYGSQMAAQDLARAVRVNPGDYYAHLHLGQALADQGRCDRALLSLDAASRLYPTARLPERLLRRCEARLARTPGTAAALP